MKEIEGFLFQIAYEATNSIREFWDVGILQVGFELF